MFLIEAFLIDHTECIRTFVIRTPASNPGKVKNMLRTWSASRPRPYLVKFAGINYFIHKHLIKLRTS